MRDDVRNVTVNLSSVYPGEDGREQVAMDEQCAGTARKIKGTWHIHFIEMVSEDQGKVDNLLTFDEKSFSLNRRGEVTTQMTFEQGRDMLSRYQTPYGDMQMHIKSQRVIIRETEEEIFLYAHYRLKFTGQAPAEHEVKISIKEV